MANLLAQYGRQGSLLYAPIAIAAATGQQIIIAVPSSVQKIRVIAYAFTTDTQGTIKWQSNSNDKSGAMPFGADSGISCSQSEAGWLETNAGEALNLNLSTAMTVGGTITYILSRDNTKS